MLRDPRNPDPQFMRRTDSTHEAHSKYRKTIVLLKLETKTNPVFIVVEGLCEWPSTYAELQEHDEYFYNEHTCPTNYLQVEMIYQNEDTDPHGVFEFVETVWMMDEYPENHGDGYRDYLLAVFPQMAGTVIDVNVQRNIIA